MSKYNGPRVLILDIETSPIVSYTWGLHDQNVALNQIVDDWSILSFAAKWLNEKPVVYRDNRFEKSPTDDKSTLKLLHGLLNEADIVVGQNSKAFDTKKINARFIIQGMKPPSSYKQLDTMLMAKKSFAFTSNKLEYLSKTLNKKYKKLDHKKYPGFEMWRAVLKGDKAAWKEMETYNKYDVMATEELYNILQPWGSDINFDVYKKGDKPSCNCGSTHYVKNGYAYTSNGRYQRYSCSACGKEMRSKKNTLCDIKRKSMLTRIT